MNRIFYKPNHTERKSALKGNIHLKQKADIFADKSRNKFG